jgi:predicted metal-dependent hydrolase
VADPNRLATALIEAARAFNSGQYFETHEILEDALDHVPDELWDLVVGLIQIAVGYHKVTQQLQTGAAGMLDRGLEKVDPFPPDAGGVNLELLRSRARTDCDALHAGRFDENAFRQHPPRLQLARRRDGSVA